MDVPWPTVQNWALFGAVAGGLVYYYYPKSARAAPKGKPAESTSGAAKRQGATIGKQLKKALVDDSGADSKQQSGSESKKKKNTKKVHVQAPSDPVPVVRNEEPEDIDMSTRQFAQQMAKARQGNALQTTKSKDKRVKTVKQGSALDTQGLSSASSQTGADADDDLSPIASPALRAGDVDDMLAPSPAAPTTLRITGNVEQQKQNKAKKEEVVETKKQRQNREKVERRRLEREEEEKVRKALEEKQRRSAREARGEPAKNGIAVAKAPANNAWSQPKRAAATAASDNGPLLDTFDVESTASSTGALGLSTAATSATDGSTSRLQDELSEEEQLAQAMKQSSDESGWQTVNQPKKSKKKGGETASTGDSTPIPVPAPVVKKQAPTATKGVKPKGFQVLEVAEPEQTAGADPDDLDNWTA